MGTVIWVNIGAGDGMVSHYLNQCWFTFSKVHSLHWHSFECKFTRDTSAINSYSTKISLKFPRGQWVNILSTSCKIVVGWLAGRWMPQNSICDYQVNIGSGNGLVASGSYYRNQCWPWSTSYGVWLSDGLIQCAYAAWYHVINIDGKIYKKCFAKLYSNYKCSFDLWVALKERFQKIISMPPIYL